MTPQGAAKLLWDAREAVDRIARVVTGFTFSTYLADDVVRWAVERQFIVVGEALAALRRDYPDQAQEIPDLARIVAFRNVLIHGYAAVDDRLVWGVIERDLEVLRSAIAALLEQPGPAQ